MRCKRCGTLLTANTLRRCRKCAADEEKMRAKKYVGAFGPINRAFDLVTIPLKLDVQLMWISVPLVVFLGLLVAFFVVIYAVTILPIQLLFRALTGAAVSEKS